MGSTEMDRAAIARRRPASDWQGRCRRRGGVLGAVVAWGIAHARAWWRLLRTRPCVFCRRVAPYAIGGYAGWWVAGVLMA